MNSDRIKELQEQTGYPQSICVYKALLQVWNECQREHNEQLRLHSVTQQRELLAKYTKWQNEVNYSCDELMYADIDKFLNGYCA